MKLIDVPEGKTVQVVDIEGGMGVRNRLAAIGLYPGAPIKVVKSPPGPLIVEVAGSRIALGKGMASKIEVMKLKKT